MPPVTRKTDLKYLERWLQKRAKIMNGTVGAYSHNVRDRSPIHPEYVAAMVGELADDEASFTTDTGMTNIWTARYITRTANAIGTLFSDDQAAEELYN
jgi:pyruvate dehydrogenase (quinone)